MFISIITIHKRQFAVLRKMMLRSKFIRWILYVLVGCLLCVVCVVCVCLHFAVLLHCFHWIYNRSKLCFAFGRWTKSGCGKISVHRIQTNIQPGLVLYNECVKSTEHLCCIENVWRFEANVRNLDKYSENEKWVEEAYQRKREKYEQQQLVC